MYTRIEKAFSKPGVDPWSHGGGQLSHHTPKGGMREGLSGMEELHLRTLYIPLVPQLTYWLKGQGMSHKGTCIAREWNGDKAYGDDRE